MEYMMMPLKRYADFSGRSRRMEFWMWQLFQIIVYVGITILMMLFGGGMMLTSSDPTAAIAVGSLEVNIMPPPNSIIRIVIPT